LRERNFFGREHDFPVMKVELGGEPGMVLDGGVGFHVMTHQVVTKCAGHVHSEAYTLGGAVGAENTVLG
jgi:hypothetical protein